MRDYARIAARARALQGNGLLTRELGRVEGYPLLAITLGQRPDRPTVLLLAGTHGDEPAGVETAFELCRSAPSAWLEHLRFEVVPCLNPFGYVRDTRHNAQGLDVNWSYARPDVPELALLRRLIAGRRFAFAMDLHEDWESPGFYLYELRRGADPIGLEITRRVARVCPVNTAPSIEGYPADRGLILPTPEREAEWRGRGIPIAVYHEHTDHWLTTETPTHRDLGSRIEAHRVALDTAVEAHLRRVAQPAQ
jgi:hypothetical protein